MTYAASFFQCDFGQNIWFFEKFFVILHPISAKYKHEAILVLDYPVDGIARLLAQATHCVKR